MHTFRQILFFYLDPLLSYASKQCEWVILMAKSVIRMRHDMWHGGRRSSDTTYLKSATPICLFII